MARFYGEIKGNRGKATRLGSKHFTAHIGGWEFGIRVLVTWDAEKGQEVYQVYTTGGSNDSSSKTLIASYRV